MLLQAVQSVHAQRGPACVQLLRLADRETRMRHVCLDVGMGEDEFRELPRHLKVAALTGGHAIPKQPACSISYHASATGAAQLAISACQR